VDVVRLARKDDHVDLRALLSTLFERSVALAFVEGGPTLATAFARDGLVDRVVGYHAPLLLGAGLPLSGDLGVSTLSSAIQLTVDDVCSIGDDVRIDARITTRSG
jgi:diaminohydroxyphosphoribosylaminopyrimidine deaminase/5-amino-6-(5-phosphoribosylamino)uracil reductase